MVSLNNPINVYQYLVTSVTGLVGTGTQGSSCGAVTVGDRHLATEKTFRHCMEIVQLTHMQIGESKWFNLNNV